MKKKLALLLPFWPILFFLLSLLIFGKSSGFGVHKISANLPFHAEWEALPGPSDLATLLSQSFHYETEDRQTYSFLSEDQKYRLIFFKMEHFMPDTWRKLLPFAKNREKNARRIERLNATFSEYAQSSRYLYVHLNSTQHLQQRVTVFGADQERFSVFLDSTPFLLEAYRVGELFLRVSANLESSG
jgi:hypothetical protein